MHIGDAESGAGADHVKSLFRRWGRVGPYKTHYQHYDDAKHGLIKGIWRTRRLLRIQHMYIKKEEDGICEITGYSPS